MPASEPFKRRHFQSEIILLNVQWYLRYSLSYRDLAEMMMERGVQVNHTTIYRWVQSYSPEIDQRCRPYLRPTNDSWRVDETYIKLMAALSCKCYPKSPIFEPGLKTAIDGVAVKVLQAQPLEQQTDFVVAIG